MPARRDVLGQVIQFVQAVSWRAGLGDASELELRSNVTRRLQAAWLYCSKR
jgi:hypothetical protein